MFVFHQFSSRMEYARSRPPMSKFNSTGTDPLTTVYTPEGALVPSLRIVEQTYQVRSPTRNGTLELWCHDDHGGFQQIS
jgi:hypothetical protein